VNLQQRWFGGEGDVLLLRQSGFNYDQVLYQSMVMPGRASGRNGYNAPAIILPFIFEKIWVLNWNELGVVDVKWIVLYCKSDC